MINKTRKMIKSKIKLIIIYRNLKKSKLQRWMMIKKRKKKKKKSMFHKKMM